MYWSSRLRTKLRVWLECIAIFVISRALGAVPAYYFAEYWRLILATRQHDPSRVR
jgi:hypothetical protein